MKIIFRNVPIWLFQVGIAIINLKVKVIYEKHNGKESLKKIVSLILS
jgi:hypothetical protein